MFLGFGSNCRATFCVLIAPILSAFFLSMGANAKPVSEFPRAAHSWAILAWYRLVVLVQCSRSWDMASNVYEGWCIGAGITSNVEYHQLTRRSTVTANARQIRFAKFMPSTLRHVNAALCICEEKWKKSS